MKNVANRRMISGVRHAVDVLFAGSRKDLGNFALRIVYIAEETSVCAAGFNTGGLLADFLQMTAESTFFDNLIFRIKGTGTVGASGDAHLAADAFFLIHEYLAVFGFEGSSGRTDFHARCVAAILTNGRQEVLLEFRKFSDGSDG